MLKYRKYFYTLSILLVTASIGSLAIFGLNLGIDFKGGSLMEVEFENGRPSHDEVREAVADTGIGDMIIQDIGSRGLIMRFNDVDEVVHQDVLNKLGALATPVNNSTSTSGGEAPPADSARAGFSEVRFESIGPVIGEETKRKSLWAISLVLVMILVYVAWTFRRVSFPLKSWQYGVIALTALFHDIVITVGIFSILGHFLNIEVGVPFVAALLTILGYSVNDTIVVFDRIRENVLRQGSTFDFGEVVNKSVSQTYVRSINTSMTTLVVLFSIFLFGGSTIHYFVLTLMIGVAVGTYSSLYLASPLLFSWSMLRLRKR